MAGPISGIGAQQQVPVSQLQQGQNNNNEARESEGQESRQEAVREQGAPTETQQAESPNQNVVETTSDVLEQAFDPEQGSQADARPGELVNILV